MLSIRHLTETDSRWTFFISSSANMYRRFWRSPQDMSRRRRATERLQHTMEGILKVTPEKLIQTSGTFATTGNQIKNLTSEMISQVQSMKGVWQGEAAMAYGNKFQSLQSDMDRLYRMVQEHVKDLQEMASQYQKAEAGNSQQGGSLNSNVVV